MDKVGVDPVVKIGDNKGGVGVWYKGVVGVANISFREKVLYNKRE